MHTILLQAPAGGGGQQWIFLVVMIGIFYLFFIRPQQRKQKNQRTFVSDLKKGDQIVTMGGIHGKITEVTDSTVTIDVDRGTKLTIEKSSISMEASNRKNEEKQ